MSGHQKRGFRGLISRQVNGLRNLVQFLQQFGDKASVLTRGGILQAAGGFGERGESDGAAGSLESVGQVAKHGEMATVPCVSKVVQEPWQRGHETLDNFAEFRHIQRQCCQHRGSSGPAAHRNQRNPGFIGGQWFGPRIKEPGGGFRIGTMAVRIERYSGG